MSLLLFTISIGAPLIMICILLALSIFIYKIFVNSGTKIIKYNLNISNKPYDIQDLLMKFPVRTSELSVNKGINLFYSTYKNKWTCGYLGEEELNGYGDTPLEAVYNCFVNCANNNIIKNGWISSK